MQTNLWVYQRVFSYTGLGSDQDNGEPLLGSASSKWIFTGSHIQGHLVHYAPLLVYVIYIPQGKKKDEDGDGEKINFYSQYGLINETTT